ncbi:unnamed protein product [Closterium sp. NIES-54]
MASIYHNLLYWPCHIQTAARASVASSPLGIFVAQIKAWHVLCVVALAVQVYLFRSYEPRFNAIGNFVQKGVSSYDGLLSTSRQNGQDNVFSNNWQQPQQQENQGEQEQEPQRQPLVNFAPQQLPQQQRQERGPEQQQQQQQQEQEQQQRQSQEQQQQQERQSQEQQKQDGLSSPQDDPRPRDFTGLDDSQLHLVVHETCKLEKLGGRKKDGYGAWTLCTNHLRPGGIVYSFGIGGDVTFDNEMVNRGYKVFGFDPTVTPDHVSSLFKNNHERDQPSTFQFCQVGIGAVDGIITFFSPKNPRLKSMTAVKHEELSKRYESQGMPAPVMRLPTFMCTNGHGFIDVLKIDVEGVEFDICDEWLRMDTPLPVGQVLLEFHDRLLKDGKLRRKACLEVMAREGFTEVFVSRILHSLPSSSPPLPLPFPSPSPPFPLPTKPRKVHTQHSWFHPGWLYNPHSPGHSFPQIPFPIDPDHPTLPLLHPMPFFCTCHDDSAFMRPAWQKNPHSLRLPSPQTPSPPTTPHNLHLHPKPHVLPFFCTCDDDSALMEDSLARCQVASDFLIALAYLSIPLELAYFTLRARTFSHRWVMLLFSLFIVLCVPVVTSGPVLIALAYLSIPLELAYFTLRARTFSHRWVMLLFSLFIVLCGLTHLVNVWTYGAHPRQLSVVQTVLKVLCAAVSWGTAFVLFTIIPSLLKFKANGAQGALCGRVMGHSLCSLHHHPLAPQLQGKYLFSPLTSPSIVTPSSTPHHHGGARPGSETSYLNPFFPPSSPPCLSFPQVGRHVRMLTYEIRQSLDRHTILNTTLVELAQALMLENCTVWMPDPCECSN